MKTKNIILSRKWDILIILDACRYDVFRELYGSEFNVLEGESEGSCTVEWFYNTFVVDNVRLDDVVYVSGSPYVSNHLTRLDNMSYYGKNHFFRVVDVWDFGFRKVGYAYVVDPQMVYNWFNIVKTIHKNKRFIVHFMQPHAPYPHCKELSKYYIDKVGYPDLKLWEAMRKGEVNPKLALECYKNNLQWVMKYVYKIVENNRDKRIVITADHGEAFGEHGLYDHPCYRSEDVLRKVPLVFCDKN